MSNKKVEEPTFGNEPIPRTIWDKARQQIIARDPERTQWGTQNDRAICVNAKMRKRIADFPFGMAYSCLHCSEKGNVRVPACDGEMDMYLSDSPV